MKASRNIYSMGEIKEKPKKRYCLKAFLGLTLTIILLSVVGYVAFWQFNKFPEPTGPIAKEYSWQYKSKTYNLRETLYQSIDNYYSKKIKGIFNNFEDISVGRYLNTPEKDETIPEVTQKIRELANKNQLTDDQTIDLVLSLVQSLPYDEARAKTDLTHPRYPYETLFESKGICSDKTLLAVAILRQLGYGTAIFMYGQDQHMTAAVQCPAQYSNYNSGYCIAETTAVGQKIGIIPELNQSNLQAVQRSEVQTFDGKTENQGQNKKLSKPEIFTKTQGKIYQEIVATIETEKEIEELSVYLGQQKPIIEKNELELNRLKTQLDQYYAQENIQQYNNLVPIYNDLVRTTKRQIDEYNQKVVRYNALIKE